MRPVSQRWLDTIRGSHQVLIEARVCEPEQTGVDPTGTVIEISGGDIRWDTQSDVLATVQITVPDASLYPEDAGDLLAPYGNELFLRRGIDYGGGAVEWVSLGYYRINSVEQDDARGGPLRVSGSDRMWRVVANPVTAGSFPATDTRGSLVAWLILTASITATIEWDDAAVRDGAIGRVINVENDRFEVLDEFITSLSKIWYWDYRGILVIKSPPDTDVPVWDVDAGPSGVLVQMGRSLSDEGVYNYVDVTGAAPDGDGELPPGSVAADGDVDSPTWTGSKFGVVSIAVHDTMIVTNPQANALAKTLLRSYLGFPKQIDFTSLPNAALEPWDPVRVRLRTGEEDVHVIRSLTIPLTPTGALTGETREYVAEV